MALAARPLGRGVQPAFGGFRGLWRSLRGAGRRGSGQFPHSLLVAFCGFGAGLSCGFRGLFSHAFE